MLTVTSKSFYEKIRVDNDEVILNGPPDFLCGQIKINNNQTEILSVRELPIQHNKKSALTDMHQLNIGMRLKPNESREGKIVHQVNPQTPPGVYESFIEVGGEKRTLKLVVQPTIRVEIIPLSLTFQNTAPGNLHTANITISNNGNMPFQIPEVKHITMMDMDYLCRATAIAIRSKGASETYAGMMDELTRNVYKSMTDWLEVSVKEAGQILEPGYKILASISFTMPANADAKRDYSGEIRLWDQVITYHIKSHIVEYSSKK